MYSSTNRSDPRAPRQGYTSSYSTAQPNTGQTNYGGYMGSNGGGGQPRRSSGQDESPNSSFGFNSFGFPSFNVQNLTQSFSNNFNPATFSNFMSGQNTGQPTAAQSGSSNRPTGTTRSQSTSSEPQEKYCEHCCTKFNYFKRRRTCVECNMDYCSNCFTSDTFLGTQSSRVGTGRQTCRKCRIFKLNPPDRHYLMTLRVKDLRWYLDRKGMSSQGCKEKSELVDLIMTYHGYRPSHSVPNNPSSYRESSLSRRAAEDVLLRGQSLDGSRGFGGQNNERRSSSSSPSSDASSWVLVEDDGQQTDQSSGVVGAVGGAAPTHSHPPPELLVRPTVADPVSTSNNEPLNQSNDSNLLQQPIVSSSSGRESPSFYSGSPARSDPSDFKSFNIDDVQSEDQLQSLSVRQLKLILTRNFVDYKGCCEREELLEKVVRLWREKKAFKEQNPDEIPDENLCKICMERPVDCVLLECGHMISCVNCGKRLAECPMCRQYVVRVVRTFRS